MSTYHGAPRAPTRVSLLIHGLRRAHRERHELRGQLALLLEELLERLPRREDLRLLGVQPLLQRREQLRVHRRAERGWRRGLARRRSA